MPTIYNLHDDEAELNRRRWSRVALDTVTAVLAAIVAVVLLLLVVYATPSQPSAEADCATAGMEFAE